MRILKHYPLCPFSRSIRLLLAEKQLDFSLEVENFWEKNPEFLKINSLGDVPVLLDLNGTIVSNILSIFEYLEEVYPHPSFLGLSLKQKAEVRRLFALAYVDLAKDVTWPLLMEKHLKRFYKTIPDASILRSSKKNLLHLFEYLLWLVSNRNWMAGDTLSFVDLFMASQFSVLDYMNDIAWDHFLPLKEWYVRVKSRPSFRPLLLERVSGLTPPHHYEDLDF